MHDLSPAAFIAKTMSALDDAQGMMHELLARKDELTTAIHAALAAIDHGDHDEARTILAAHAGLAADARQVN
jgi:hypothetical protein